MASKILFPFHDPNLARSAEIARKYGSTMMAKLKAFVATLEEVAAEHRDLYVEDTAPDKTKRFKLDADGLEDVSALRSTVTALRGEVKTLRDKAKPLADVPEGEDVDAIITAGRAELARVASGKPRDEVTNATSQMKTAHDKEMAKIRGELDGAIETLREVLIANEVRAASADPEIKANATLILPHIEKMATVVKVEGEDGKPKYRASVLNAEKKERVDKDGNPMTIRGVVAELREKPEFAGAFSGSGASGSGTPPDGGSGMPTPPRTPAAPKDAAAKDAKRRTNDYGSI